ncbi:MAG TPA: hypothetical protein VG248_04880 [Caulobacteraceae bacterium]|jgi:hypothetical protein|nr:hypothetical protein [Caulobacteraceae bacterium]
MKHPHRFAKLTPLVLAGALMAGAAAAQPAPLPPVPAGPPSAAAPSPENLALVQEIVAPAAPILDAAIAPVCAGGDAIGRAKDLPPERKAKAIAASQPICLRAIGRMKTAAIGAAAQAFTREDLQAILEFSRSPEVVGVLVQIAASGPHPKPTDEQKAQLKDAVLRFIATPAGQDVKLRVKTFVALVMTTVLPQAKAAEAEVEAAACEAGGCPAA